MFDFAEDELLGGIANENARGSEPLFLSKISNANSPNNSSSAK